MKALFSIFRFIFFHPLSKGRQLNALLRFIIWQLRSTFIKKKLIVNWVNSSKFILSKGETGLSGNYYCGFMELEEMSFLLHYIRSSDDLYDIGSNVGAYSILASAVRGSKSYAFEPLPDTYERLVNQIKINKIEHLVSAKNCGVGANSEILEFTNSLNCMNKVNTIKNNINVTKVPVVTLDSKFQPINSSIVKIDVEGYEKFVIDGGINFFNNDNVKALIIELNGSGVDFGVPDKELDAEIRKFGFVSVNYNPFDRSIQIIEGFNDGGNTIYLKDISDAKKRCNLSENFIIHTAGSKIL